MERHYHSLTTKAEGKILLGVLQVLEFLGAKRTVVGPPHLGYRSGVRGAGKFLSDGGTDGAGSSRGLFSFFFW